MKLVYKILHPIWTRFAMGFAKVFVRLQKHDNTNSARKLLFIVPWLTIGGAEKVNLDIMTGLKKDGWEIYIITTKLPKHEWKNRFKEFTSNIIHIERLPERLHGYILIELIKKFDINLAFISNSYTGYLSTPYLYKYVPIVDLIHGEGGVKDQGGTPRFSRVFDQYLSKRLVISEHLKRLHTETYGINPQKIEVIYNGIDINQTLSSINNSLLNTEELEFLDRKNKVAWIARMSPEKQALEVVKLAKEIPDYNFVMVGGGELLDNIAENAKSLNNLLLTGEASNEKAKTILAKCDVLIMTSEFEGMPLVILEAMCLSKPVVSTNVGAIKEMVEDGISGYLVDANQIQTQMPVAISKALVNKEQLGKNAFKLVEQKFTIEKMHIKYLNIFNNLVHVDKK